MKYKNIKNDVLHKITGGTLKTSIYPNALRKVFKVIIKPFKPINVK
ncbi:hypothetical protein [Companilactobacillus insicii]|nr:hypothetical protein [Companilactobacillus insicii]